MSSRYLQSRSCLDLVERYDVAVSPNGLAGKGLLIPGSRVPVVFRDADGLRKLRAMRWGAIWRWGRRESAPLAHLRAESLIDKPVFHPYLRAHRCLLPADAVYLWRQEPGGRRLYRTVPRDGDGLSIGGLMNINPLPDGRLELAAAMITTRAADSEGTERLPVLIRRDQESRWLDLRLTNLHDIFFALAPQSPELLRFEPANESEREIARIAA